MKKNGKAVQSDALVLFGVTGDSGQPQLLWLNTKNASQTRLSIELISIWKLRVEHEKSI